MIKDEILHEFEKILILWAKDSLQQMQSYLELARLEYRENKKELIEILHDWLLNHAKPGMQYAALRIIEDLKIYELKKDIYSLKREIIKTRKQPFLGDDLEVVEKTISALENKQDG